VGVNRVGNGFIVVHPVLPTVPKGLSTANAQRKIDAPRCLIATQSKQKLMRKVLGILQGWHARMSRIPYAVKCQVLPLDVVVNETPGKLALTRHHITKELFESGLMLSSVGTERDIMPVPLNFVYG
jgi:hypothetical protein